VHARAIPQLPARDLMADDVRVVDDQRPAYKRTHELLREILERLDAIDAELAERERVPTSRLHLSKGAHLAREVNAAIGDAVFTVFELVDHARRVDAQWHGALREGVGPLDVGATRRLLARIEGVSLPPGCRVERIDEAEADCVSWRTVRV